MISIRLLNKEIVKVNLKSRGHLELKDDNRGFIRYVIGLIKL